jgi:2-keto-4-pentenoate hydratase/2-oxohepta-3-ene-1,7-dioic acid hydratase in catechol pathway
VRLANVDGRAVHLTSDDKGFDVETASSGKYGPHLPEIYENWDGFRSWAKTIDPTASDVSFTRDQLRSPSPQPRQIVAIGLNYRDHAAESGFALPEGLPPTFTKFVSSLTGPDATVTIPAGGNLDWEVELVVVIGRTTKHVSEQDAWEAVAGLTIGQDLSERISQLQGPAPQFSLGKSFPSFAPVGPWLVSPEEVPSKDDLELGCAIDGEVVQLGKTGDLLFPVPALISRLSQVITLYPGDLIFTGTPAGVGLGRQPQRFLRPGETLRSWIDGIGEMRQKFVAPLAEA